MSAFEKISGPSEESIYTFQSKPKNISSRPKYRLEYIENEEQVLYGNIMYDKRVVRGNTYAPTTLPLSQYPDPIEVQREQEIKRRRLAKRKAGKQFISRRMPEAVEVRKHIEIQTELYLEPITNRIEEADIDTHTDVLLDRPPTPLFIPATTSKGVETQIYRGDLFNFNDEVKPILEVMVGKTLNQSMIEVLEEEELACLREQQFEFEEVRNAELVEMQRLEDQERRYREEKEIRMEQQRWARQQEREIADKIAAIAFASSYLLDLVPNVASCMRKNGYFFDPVERDIEQDFLPFIVDAGFVEIENKNVARMILDDLIREVCLERLYASMVPDDGHVSPPPTPDFDLGMEDEEKRKKRLEKPSDYVQLQCSVEEEDYTYDGSC